LLPLACYFRHLQQVNAAALLTLGYQPIHDLEYIKITALCIFVGVGVQNERPVVVSFADQSALQAESSTQQVLDSFAGSLDIEKTLEFRYVNQFG
jgi:hypothetical protein